MVHIHGLGINPSDDKLYVATHYGLYTVEQDQAPQRVGELSQDFMGFTVSQAPTEFWLAATPTPPIVNSPRTSA